MGLKAAGVKHQKAFVGYDVILTNTWHNLF